ncbi:MAG: nicotinate (nicotinamide) nucleotide adenylyltransferase [Flavobacteriales bacterium AspAUS03]
MKVGLYFGSFNPIHIGHLIIANHMVEFTNLDQLWLVVSPQNPLKKRLGLLEVHHRLEMVYRAIEDFPKMCASDIEFKLPWPSYTIDTLVVLEEKFPNYKFCLIIGSDALASLSQWKNYEQILAHYPIYVYPRLGKRPETPISFQGDIYRIQAPVIELSASFIRKAINEGKNIKPLLPQKVWEYLDHNLFYRK